MLVRNTIKKNIQYLNFIVFFFLCLIIWKFSSHYQLSSPFFWDEAWSYMKTINWMLHNKITLSPNQIDPEVSRGHPLGFYFIISSILKIVGDNPRNAHISILVLNILSISILAHTLKRYFNYFVAFSVITLFVIQECCIVQLPFVLPELLISVLSILSILFFHFKHSRNFIVASTLLVLFKESAINILFVLLLVSISQRYVLKISHRIQTYLLIPIAIFISNYLLLKIHYGWFFFPLHTGFIKNLSFQGLEQNLSSIFQFVFYEQGRFILSILLLGGIFLKVYQFVRNDEPKFKSMSLSIYFPLVLFMISYIGFSGVNFLMLRYLLPAILVIILILILLISSFFKSHLKYLLPIILLISFISFNITTKNTWIDDCKMNAIDMINVHNEMINYLEMEISKNESIETHFLMQVNLTKKYAGYLRNDTFNIVSEFKNMNSEYIILSSMEYNDPYETKLNQLIEYFLLKEIHIGVAWCKLYQKRKSILPHLKPMTNETLRKQPKNST